MTLPEDFKRRYIEQFGPQEWALFSASMEHPSPTSIRVNPSKAHIAAEAQDRVKWSPHGLYLSSRPTFGLDPLWHGGVYYVQEASSMLISQYLEEVEFTLGRALDLCAAPGGKTTLLRAEVPSDVLLVANEPLAPRARILKENVVRFGEPEVIVTSALPATLAECPVTYDLILVDAPCSGEGMFRKDPQSTQEWSLSSVSKCVELQTQILSHAWTMLREGGVLIYSTCTYNREENEGQLQALLSRSSAQVIPLSPLPEWGVREGEESGVYRCSIHHTRGEGFTVWGVRKGGKEASPRLLKPAPRKLSKGGVPPMIKSLFPSEMVVMRDSRAHYISPQGALVADLLAAHRVPLLAVGVELAEEKGRDLIPLHPWSVSPRLLKGHPFEEYDLSAQEALAYLRREALRLPPTKGVGLVRYQGVSLGWVKNLATRVNNYYPKEFALHDPRALPSSIPSIPFIEINS